MPLTELARRNALNVVAAVLCGVAVWRIGPGPELPAVVVFIFGGVLLAAIDWKVQRLPTRIVYFTLAGVAGGLVFASVVEQDWRPLATATAGALLLTNAFFGLWLFTTKYAGLRVIGVGDIRLAAVLGLLLGWYGLPAVLYGAVAGHLIALAIVAGTYARDRRLELHYAFGPALIAGAMSVVLVVA